jgi:hypothetical protein
MHIVQTDSSLTTDMPVIKQDNWQNLLDNLALCSSILRQNWNKRHDISRYVEYASALPGDHTTLVALHVMQNASSNSGVAECVFQFRWCRMLLPIEVVQNAFACAILFLTDEDMLAEVPLSLCMMVDDILWAQNL